MLDASSFMPHASLQSRLLIILNRVNRRVIAEKQRKCVKTIPVLGLHFFMQVRVPALNTTQLHLPKLNDDKNDPKLVKKLTVSGAVIRIFLKECSVSVDEVGEKNMTSMVKVQLPLLGVMM
jgi:hypothetical protein